VLVVEDNADVRESLRLVLELGGHETELADDGPAGLAAALSRRPDVALIDLGLPVLDGYEVARKIREHLGKGVITLIALTGYGQAHDRRRATEAGFDAYLVKPVDRAALCRAIEMCGRSGTGVGRPGPAGP
jgi:two-component system, sensor histidine kinase